MAAIEADLFSACALQTAATHLMNSGFCASAKSVLPRSLKNNVAVPPGAIAATILPSFAGSASFGSPEYLTMVTSPIGE